MKVFSENNFQKWLFILAGVAFVLSLLKNVFLDQHPGAGYYVIEFLAFLFFLSVIFFSDKTHSLLRKRISEIKQRLEGEQAEHEKQVKELKETIARYEEKENEAARIASYQDKVIGKLTSDKKVYHDKHHLLFLLSEVFHGMAAVLYKKDEPSNHFFVEAFYGLTDDFEPRPFQAGEGIHGQVVKERKPELIEEVPEDYAEVSTGLGRTLNYYLYMLPVIRNNVCTGMIELLTFRESDVERIWPEVMNKLVEKEIL